jgi:hypothetical protein
MNATVQAYLRAFCD